MSAPWVSVAFVQDADYAEIADMGIDEMAQHLAQWDYGTETDLAHGYRCGPWGSSDTILPVTVDGTDYILGINNSAGYASLTRRPVSGQEEEK